MMPYMNMNPNYFAQYGMQPQQSVSTPMQQQMPMQGSTTRLVNSFDEIQVNEIPMDGSYKLFAKSDMSEVQAKAWGSNGLINTIVFKAENSQNKALLDESKENVPLMDLSLQIEPILAEIRALNEKIDKLGRPTKRKEVVSDES